ncbi:hypothetical protein ABZ641_30190, partial [Kitasatospora sp. NPDC007106]
PYRAQELPGCPSTTVLLVCPRDFSNRPTAAAAALLRVADDPALGLDGDQRHHLTRLAADLDPRTTRDLTGRTRT